MKPYWFIILFALPFASIANPGDTLYIKDTACNKHLIFDKVEQMPDYTGGMENLIKQLNRTVLSKDTFNGTMWLDLMINCKGRVFGVEVERSIGAPMDQRVREGLFKYQDWMPGKQNGRPIDSRIPLRLPIVNGRIKID